MMAAFGAMVLALPTTLIFFSSPSANAPPITAPRQMRQSSPMMAWRMIAPFSTRTFGMITLSSMIAPSSTVQPVEMTECVMLPKISQPSAMKLLTFVDSAAIKLDGMA